VSASAGPAVVQAGDFLAAALVSAPMTVACHVVIDTLLGTLLVVGASLPSIFGTLTRPLLRLTAVQVVFELDLIVAARQRSFVHVAADRFAAVGLEIANAVETPVAHGARQEQSEQ